MNVYVINRSGHDLSPAEEFGDLVYLTSGPINKFKTNQIYRLMKPILEVSEPDDLILLSSLNVMSSIACAMFAVTHNGRLNLLLYDHRENSYKARRLDLSDLLHEDISAVLKVTKE